MKDASPVFALVLFILLLILAVLGATNLSQCEIETAAQSPGYVTGSADRTPGPPFQGAQQVFQRSYGS